MAIEQSVVIALNIMYGNQASSASDLEWWASPAAADITYDQAVVLFATSAAAQSNYPYLAAPNIASPEQYVTQIFANSYGIAAADIDPLELEYWVNWLSLPDTNGIPNYLELPSVINQFSPPERQAALVNRADVALDFTQKMLAAGNPSFTEAQSGNSWAIINTVTAAPETVVAAKASTDQFIANGGGQTGNTFVFTAAIDSLTGGTANDSFIGDNSGATTVQAADQVNGGGGTDTFKYFAPNKALPSLSDVENVQLLFATGAVDGIDFAPLAGKGIQQVTFVGSAPDVPVTVKGLSGIAFGVENVTTGTPSLTGDFGSATAATFIVTSSQVGDITLTGASIKSLDIKSEGKGNNLNDLIADGKLETISVVGTGGLTITKALDDSVTTIDASKHTGGVNLTPGVSDLKLTGGSGADTVSFAATQFDSKDVLDGGAGKDTLRLADVAIPPLAGALNAAKNFETLSFTGAGATVDAGAITAFTDYRLEGAGNFTVTNASSTNTFTVAVDNVGNATSIANKLGQSTANLTIEGTKFDAGTLSLDGLTTLNLASTKGGAAAGANTVNFNAGTPVDNLTILVTGNQGLTIGSPTVTKTGVTLDATKFTASLTATGTNKVDILTGSAQNDSLTGNGGADTLTGGGGADTFILNQAAAGNTVIVTDFTVDQNDVFALSNAAYAGAPAAGSKLTLSAVSGAPNAATTILVDTQANINAASIANIRFAYGSDTKTLWYDADGNFTAGSVAIATSTLAITPTASSFSIV